MTARPIDKLDQRLGIAIRTRRISQGLSQQALGKAIGIAGQQLQRHELGRNQLTVARLADIATALDWSVFMLLSFALGEHPTERRDVSDRATLELIKRFSALKPNERAGVVLLVRKLAEEV